MSKIIASLVLLSTLSSVATPAFALGGCGVNGHRDQWNNCVFGGQRQDYCLSTKGHYRVRMPNGIYRCL